MKKVEQKKVLRYKLIVDEETEISGIDKISVVADPAIEVKGYCFNNQNHYQFSDTEKMIIAAPVAIPYKIMPRKAEDGSIYEVYFDDENLIKMFHKFMKANKNTSFNFEHTNKQVQAFLVGVWLIDDPEMDKSRIYGFKSLPKNTFFIEVKIEDKEFWNEYVKQGHDSFSLEGWFNEALVKFNKEQFEIFNIDELIELERFLDDELKKKFDQYYDNIISEQLISKGKDYGDELLEDGEDYEEMIDDVEDNDFETFAKAIDSTADSKSSIDKGLYKIRYKYDGGITSKSREFCKKMHNANKLYRVEDIDWASNNIVNEGFGISGSTMYNIFKYKGGANCKHKWTRVIFIRKRDKGKVLPNDGLNNDKPISVSQALRAGLVINKQPSEASIKTINLPNSGYYK